MLRIHCHETESRPDYGCSWRRLEKLSLEQITLAPDALKACTLPRLRSLRLRDCGAETEMRTLAAELTEACPMLEEDKVQVHAYTGRRR